MNALLRDATKILCEGTDDSYVKVQAILEDVESPITKTYKEKLFESIISRAHIDFGDIPRSKGDITKYSGYQSMLDCLHSLLKVANEEKSKELTNAVNTVLAATTLISNYIDFIKTPSSNYVMELKNTKFRANALYLDQLERFNKVNVNGSYNKYISTVVQKGQENFLLDPAIIAGAAFVSVIALSIIPVTRELIYLYNETKRKLSDLFALQAYYLEMNKTALEYNTEIKSDKKNVIIQKQDKIRKKFLYLSEKLRIADIKAEQTSKKRLETDNRGMSTGSLEDDVNDSDMVLM